MEGPVLQEKRVVMYALAYFYIYPEFACRNIWKIDNQTAKEVNEKAKM